MKNNTVTKRDISVLPNPTVAKNPINIYATEVMGIYDIAYWGAEKKDGKDFIKVHVENMESGLGELYVDLVSMETISVIKMKKEEIAFVLSWLEANKKFIVELAKKKV